MPSTRKGALVTTFVYALACGCSSNVVALTFPDVEARAWIVALASRTSLRLTALEGAVERFDSTGFDDPADVELLAYSESLAELSLAPGLVPLVDDSDGRSLPVPSAVYSGTVESHALELRRGMSERLTRALIPKVPTTCPTLELVGLGKIEGSMNDGAFVVKADESHSLVGSQDGYFALVSHEGEVTRVTATSTVGVFGATRVAEELWIWGHIEEEVSRGGVWRARLEGTRLVLESPRFLTGLGGLRFVESVDGDSFFGLTSKGEFGEWRDGSWRTLEDFGQPPDAVRGALLERSARALWISFSSFPGIKVWDGRSISDEFAPGVDFPVSSLSFIDALGGPVLGGGAGGIFVKGPEGWTQLVGAPIVEVRNLSPFERGFVFSGQRGSLVQYTGERFCEHQPPFSGSVQTLAAIPETKRLVLVSDATGRSSPWIAVVELADR
ncbi:MAG: hypothetical protein HY791_38875 [Deltaproteobacteria bacterium]|nr:hypothetical protein [Deltaproteobacteria bacterium]